MSRLEVIDLSLEVLGRRLLSGVHIEADAGECLAVMGPSHKPPSPKSPPTASGRGARLTYLGVAMLIRTRRILRP
jgi:ABC-type uncharacterized transport system YnjBCD ATPase subunit